MYDDTQVDVEIDDAATGRRRPVGISRSRRALVAVGSLAGGVALAVAPPGAAHVAPPDEEDHSFHLLNDVRAAEGQVRLDADGELRYAARMWAGRMADGSFLDHNHDLPDAISWGWWMWGENVGRGLSVDRIHNAFVASPSHHRNLVDSRFTHVGIGGAYGPEGRIYIVQAFGAW